MKSPAKTIYLDHAAATPLAEEAWLAMQPYFEQQFYNPSALYLYARDVRTAVEAARHDAAQTIGARSGEIIFTAGASEANNLAIQGVMEQYPGSTCLVSSIEHDSVIKPANRYNCKKIPCDEQGIIRSDNVTSMIDDTTVLISIMHVNNEVGTVQPISEIAESIKAIREKRLEMGNQLPLYLHSDAAQSANYFDIHVQRLGVDMLSLNGGKLYGPKQSGLLYVRRGIELKPLILGGGQEFGLRSGTENVAGIIGLAVALKQTQEVKSAEVKRLGRLRDVFIKELLSIPASMINGSLKHRAPNNIHMTFDGIDNEWLVMSLDEAGIMVGVGSACSASSDEPSHVLLAMGRTKQQAQNSIRITLGRTTTDKQLVYVAETIKRLISVKR